MGKIKVGKSLLVSDFSGVVVWLSSRLRRPRLRKGAIAILIFQLDQLTKVTICNPSTPPEAQGVLSKYVSEVHCANDHIKFNQN